MRHFSVIIALAVVLSVLSISIPARADGPFIWEADTGLGGIADKAEIGKYLDNLKAHYVNGVWVQVELYGEGTVNYKKTGLSKLPTAAKFKTGQWADDDFLSYVIAQAKSRGMKVMIKLHGSNDAAWNKHPDWRKLDSKGKEVLWSGRLKNFCVNAPYWDTMFLPMVREIAQNYDVDGLYLDTCQVAPEGSDACFCPYCKARFEKETGKKLPLKPVDSKNWVDPIVKLHATKRVEWLNEFYEQYAQAIEQCKPGAAVLLNVSGGYNSYKDGVYARHAGKYVTYMTPEPVNTPRMYAVVKNQELKKAGKKPIADMDLAREEILPSMNRFGYYQFMVKTMLAEGGSKPVVPFSRFWFTSGETMGPVDLEIAQIESGINAGAKGQCFFGYLAGALASGQTKGTAWDNPKFLAYLKDLTTGERAKWIADMQPDWRIAILYDGDASFWNADYWTRLKRVGRLFSYLQYGRKLSVGLVAVSEPDLPGFGKSGYKLTKEILSKYNLVFAPGLDYVSAEDLQTLKDFVDGTGNLIIMGGIGGHGKFPGKPTSDDAYRIFGITTVSGPEPSGYIIPKENHPIFMIPGGFTGPGGSFRYSTDKNAAPSYKPKFGDGWKVLADEYTDSGKRPAILYKSIVRNDPTKGGIAYMSSDGVDAFTWQALFVIANMVVVVPSRADVLNCVRFSPETSVNGFASADGMTRYLHILTPKGESGAFMRIRANPGTYPILAQIIVNGGDPKPLTISLANRDPLDNEMVVAPRGNGVLKLADLPPGFAMVKLQYEARAQK